MRSGGSPKACTHLHCVRYIWAMKIIQILRTNRLTQHIIFWIAYFSFVFFIAMMRWGDGRELEFSVPFELTLSALFIIAVYVNLLVLIPHYLHSKRYVLYGVLVVMVVLVNALILYFIVSTFPDFKPHNMHRPKPSLLFPVPIMMGQFMLIAVTSALHFLRENLRLQESALNIKELESSRLHAELTSLKSQINPHFLFNSLNNIYSHSLLESKQTPELILKLSGLLNYLIYETRDDLVDLGKEMDFLTNYIDLERVRIDESVPVDVNIDVTDRSVSIAPLLFLPLVENAFKHGVNLSSGSPYISIDIQQEPNGNLVFNCRNLLEKHPLEETGSGGIGLENVKKRLELIYPDRHELNINKSNGEFVITVNIALSGESNE